MPALVVVVKMHATRDAAFGLEADNIGQCKVASCAADLLAERQHRRDHGHRRMAAQRPGYIVVIQRVRGHAIDQSGVKRTGAPVGREDQTRAGGRCDARHVHQDAWAVLHHAGERDADRVDERGAGPFKCCERQILVAQAVNSFGNLMGE
jgi:hypothetical protein